MEIERETERERERLTATDRQIDRVTRYTVPGRDQIAK